jgi:hypothetical protein
MNFAKSCSQRGHFATQQSMAAKYFTDSTECYLLLLCRHGRQRPGRLGGSQGWTVEERSSGPCQSRTSGARPDRGSRLAERGVMSVESMKSVIRRFHPRRRPGPGSPVDCASPFTIHLRAVRRGVTADEICSRASSTHRCLTDDHRAHRIPPVMTGLDTRNLPHRSGCRKGRFEITSRRCSAGSM